SIGKPCMCSRTRGEELACRCERDVPLLVRENAERLCSAPQAGTVKLCCHNSNMRLSSILLRVGIGAIFQCVVFATSPGPPGAQTQAANSIGSNSATLNSYVDPSGLDTLVYFQYGLSTAYENSTPTGDVGTTVGHYGVPLSGLSASTTYHF